MRSSLACALINVSQGALTVTLDPALPESERVAHLREAHEAVIQICRKLCEEDSTEKHRQQVASAGDEIRPLVGRLLPRIFAEKAKIINLIGDIKDPVIHDTVRDILLFHAVDGILQFAMDNGTISQQQYDELCLGQQKFFSAYNFGELPDPREE